MTDDRFFERLRGDAKQLQYEPADPATWGRLSARIQARIAAVPAVHGVATLLAGWFRPIAVSLAALAMVATLSLQWIERSRDTVSLETAMSANSVEISVDGDVYNLSE